MPRISVWMIRAALLHLGVGFTLGALLLWHKGAPFAPTIWRWLLPHVEMLLLGWMLQLAMGVAAWILPRFSQEPRYGNIALAWGAFISLNAGVIATSLSYAYLPDRLLAGRLLILAAGGLYGLFIWRRIKPFAESAPTLFSQSVHSKE